MQQRGDWETPLGIKFLPVDWILSLWKMPKDQLR
jgi:hypothetical protein